MSLRGKEALPGPLLVVVWGDAEGIVGVSDELCAFCDVRAEDLLGRPLTCLAERLSDDFTRLATHAAATSGSARGSFDLGQGAHQRLRFAVSVTALHGVPHGARRHVAVAQGVALIRGHLSRVGDEYASMPASEARAGPVAVRGYLETVVAMFCAGAAWPVRAAIECAAETRVRGIEALAFRHCLWLQLLYACDDVVTPAGVRVSTSGPHQVTGRCSHCGATFADRWVEIEMRCDSARLSVHYARRAQALAELGALVHHGGGHIVAEGDPGRERLRLLFVPG